MKRKVLMGAAAGCLALGLATTSVLADPDLQGTFELRSYYGGPNAPTAKVWVVDRQDGSYDLTRQVTYPNGEKGAVFKGKISLDADGWLRGTIKTSSGFVGNIGGNAETQEGVVVYKVFSSGWMYGLFRGPDRTGDVRQVFELGQRKADEPVPGDTSGDQPGDDGDQPGDDGDDGDDGPGDLPGDLRVEAPLTGGAYLVGQTVAVELSPADASLEVSGPAQRTDGGIRFTGAGEVTLKATQGGESSEVVRLKAQAPQVTKVVVEPFVDIVDAGDVQYQRALGAAEPSVQEPVVIQKGQPMTINVWIAAEENLAQKATVTVAAGDLASAQVELKGVAGEGQRITLTTSEPINAGVAINELDIAWRVAGADAGRTPLRVYTTYQQPQKNIARDRVQPATKLHFEKACGWAKGATENIGRGNDSIGYQIDNQMRHYVHSKDYESGFTPVVPDYPEGAEPPRNYDDLPGGWGIRQGQRRVSSLYYPPLEPDEDYEEYTNYRNNFGWWVLDNPNYTGGRCNQQAALVCGILGTVGIKAEILYLERTGRGKRTGRPMRNYFYAAGGGGPWNFHGVALADMADGSQWIYDGSFSSPPNRKNGSREWAENEGGPFIQSFSDDQGEIWYYDDWGGRVPADDIPEHVRGIPRKTTDNN